MIDPLITFHNTAKDKRNNEIAKLRSEYKVILEMKDAKYAKLKRQLASTKEEVVSEKAKWQAKLNKANVEVDQASDELYLEKKRRRDAVQVQINKASKKQKELQNYIDSLAEDNLDLEQEWLIALEGQKKASELRGKAEHLAAKRLEKWHNEQNARRDVQDQLVSQSRAMVAATRIIEEYRAVLQSSQDTRRIMQKEWADEAAKSKRGGRKRWSVWVVQLICELLVNGTPPTAVRGNIKIMYEMLYGEKTDDLPSDNFVRSCCSVVEVIGETITAMKLANAGNWDQLWTDATTRRQVPFTALIIGVLGDAEKVDPVVVSSCIFMEDETSESQAKGIIGKVSLNTSSMHSIP